MMLRLLTAICVALLAVPVLADDQSCFECHRETVVDVGGRAGAVGLRMAHDWLPHPESHARMRCIVCHSPPNESGIHRHHEPVPEGVGEQDAEGAADAD